MLNQNARAAGADPAATGHLDFGPFRLEIASRRLWRDDQLLSLPPKAFDLLVALITAEGRLVEKDALMRRLWPDTFVSEESLTHCVSALRRTLGDDAAHPEFIVTIPRRGYRFVAPVAGLPIAPAAAGETVGPSHAPSRILRASFPGRAVPQRGRRDRIAAVVVVMSLAVAAALTTWLLIDRHRTVADPLPPLRFIEDAPAGTSLVSGGTLSPDGRALAYLARYQETRITNLWVRTLNGTAVRMLPGTAGATRPFWSPDSRGLGFFAEGRLKTIDLGSGAVQTLATVGPMPIGGSWSTNGLILYGDRRANLFTVSSAGGVPRPATTLDRGAQESAHRYPYFLPDGDHFLYYVNSANRERAGTYIAALSGGAPRRLLDASSGGTVYAEPGFLLHVSEGRLLAHRFELSSGRVIEPPRVLATGVNTPQVINSALISVSSTGLLAYGGGYALTRLLWFDGSGRRLSQVDAPTELHNPIISADDHTLLASSIESERRGTWSVDTASGSPNWLIREGIGPVPSPNGEQMVFASNRRAGISDLFVRRTGATTETLLLHTDEPKVPTDWTNDGRFIVFTNSATPTREDIWVMPLSGDRRPVPFLQTVYNEMQGEVSPDGHWLAYASDESGRWEVYLQRFPEGGWKRTVSTTGGVEPHWQQDGRRLFFLSADQRIVRVDVSGDGESLRIGHPQPLFRAPLSADQPTIYRNQFAVTSDGSRFVIDAIDSPGAPITVVVNWPALVQPR